MKIGFLGLGKLGLPLALAVESRGHTVFGFDPAEGPREIIRTKRMAFREEGADALLEKSRIEILPVEEIVRRAEIVFVSIQTPHEPRFEGVTRIPAETRDFDYSYLRAWIAQLSAAVEAVGKEQVIVVVSTVLPGTMRREIKPLLGPHSRLCYNPCFVSMGTAIADFFNPEFVLFGVDDEKSAASAEEFYRTVHSAPFRRTTVEEAEIIKVLYNTFISTKIAFANTVMEICHHTPNADVDNVLGALQSAGQRLISDKYLGAGMGDGGSCHPRDNIALSHLSKGLNLSFDWFKCVMDQRERQSDWLADLVESHSEGREILILGRSFKPASNITTGSPSVLLANILRERGLKVVAWDPYVDKRTAAPSGKPFCYFIGTKHPEFRKWPFEHGSVVLDPFRYVVVGDGVKLVSIGRGGPLSDTLVR